MILAGRYHLERRIASGGMGTVYAAVDERLGRPVAVKLLKEEHAEDRTFQERFEREARAAAGLGHPNIAQVFDFGHDDRGRAFFVMELISGGDLGELLDDQGHLSPERAVDVASQVCSALAVAHAAGIVHRDIKPGNVMLGSDGGVKVTDFGIALARGQVTLTGTGSVLGTPQYLSPEQATGKGATPASDLYSVGVLLFEMLTGEVPFQDESPVAVALRHVTEELPSLRELAPDVPAGLDAVVARATAKDPLQRYANAREMEAALRRSLSPSTDGTRTMPQTPGAPTAGPPPAGRDRSAVPRPWLAGAAVVVLVVALGLAWLARPDGSTPADANAAPPPAQKTQAGAKLSDKPSPSPTRAESPAPSREETRTGPTVPEDAVGADVKLLEERLKTAGYDVQKVDIDSFAAKDAVVGTMPAPGQPLTDGQSVVLVASSGKPPKETSDVVVPASLVGADASAAEDSLKDQGLEVKKVDVRSDAPENAVVVTFPTPGTRAEAGVVVLAVSAGA